GGLTARFLTELWIPAGQGFPRPELRTSERGGLLLRRRRRPVHGGRRARGGTVRLGGGSAREIPGSTCRWMRARMPRPDTAHWAAVARTIVSRRAHSNARYRTT